MDPTAEPLLRPPCRELADDGVTVWRVELDQPAEVASALVSTLSADEVARARRLRFRIHRQRFEIGRGALRSIISSCTGVDPAGVRFSYGPRGKPGMVGLHFNVAHTGGLALVALSASGPVGVDLERHRALLERAAIASRYFTPNERRLIEAAGTSGGDRLFVTYWARKEAVLKATGNGLWAPLDSVDVSSPRDVDGWKIADLDVSPDHAAALATAIDAGPVEWSEWRPDVFHTISRVGGEGART